MTAGSARAPGSIRWPVPLKTRGLSLLRVDQGNGWRLVVPEPWPFCPGLGRAQLLATTIFANTSRAHARAATYVLILVLVPGLLLLLVPGQALVRVLVG